MITLAWIENEIEKAINGQNSPQNVRDFALLCIARENLKAMLEPPKIEKETDLQPSGKLTVYNADISQPTMDDVEDMLGKAVLRDESDKKKAKDMRTWMNIVDRKF